MTAHEPTPIVYTIDLNDFIVRVNAQWLVFALENHAPHLHAEGVVGTNLWTHIAEPTTRYLYRALLHQVRTTSKAVSVSFRSDSPELRRFTELRLSHRGDGVVEFESRIVKQELRLAVSLLDAHRPCSDDAVTVCSWCKKVAAPEWMEAEAAISALRLFEKAVAPKVTHGICDHCQDVLLGQVARMAPATSGEHHKASEP
jgi:hypothetical protein